MRVIGTAGHVDHGKSTLVEALTGINPDRLKEERERQMTIDLGFAWLTLPTGEPVGVIDVPGHRDFIENMLAGVGGIDAVLFVVAADEGVMPQTREHLAILDLLQIPAGVIALTKKDLVDADWLSLISADLAATVRGTVLAGAPIVAVSARVGEGLLELKSALGQILAARPPRPDLGRPRLPVDRIFSLPGFGTVVTGTLADGTFHLGDEVEILPAGITARIRGLQTHKNKIERAVPGSRVAVNLAGIEVAQLQRGFVLARPNTFRPTTLIDARFHHLPGAASSRAEASPREGARGLTDAALPLKHNAEVKLYLGAAEVLAIVRLLNHDSLAPGETAWVQLELAAPILAVKGDRFILRRPSPGATIGGGLVIDPHPKRRHKRHDMTLLARLDTLAKGSPGEMLLQALDSLGPVPLKDALAKAGLDQATAPEALTEINSQIIRLDGEALVSSPLIWRKFESDAYSLLSAHHAAHPLRLGMPREELKSKLKLAPKIFNALLAHAAATHTVIATGAVVRLPTHSIKFTPAQQASINALRADCQREPYNTPSFKDCAARLGDEVLATLVEQGMLVQLSADVLLLAETYAQAVERVKAHVQAKGKITVAEARDLFSTSRKYALALMEYLDAQGVTKRVGDERVLKA